MLLQRASPRARDGGGNLYLNGAAVKSLYCVSLYLRRASSESAEPRRPIAAFIDRGHIESLRRESLGCLLCKHYYYNPPLSRLYSKKWKKFNPPDPRYDPYIVALLISLAQQKRRYLQEINSNEEALMGMIPSHALSTFYSKGKCKEKSEEAFLGWMYLYTARIPSSLLDMLDHPHVPPAAPPAFSVQVTTISYRPLATLRARLLALLLPETPTAPAQLAGQKRKFDGQGVQQPSSRGVPPFR
ncbi:hypothetical protein Trco_003664 [Trichoderma cornu-damae]|uniref:Uncharacterized protein n=1 Tax=Trichoderma cornu-damae TaxID=654480 RepID=A0A9P8QLG9_9HYPO|nr:hypothetical protein Trco_003664 [Trichoderma cornu-damae]